MFVKEKNIGICNEIKIYKNLSDKQLLVFDIRQLIYWYSLAYIMGERFFFEKFRNNDYSLTSKIFQ